MLNLSQSSTLNRSRFSLLYMVNSTLSQRLTELMNELGLNQPQLGVEVGATKGAVNQWLSGLSKSIGAEYAFKLQRKTGYSAEWIMFGTGPKKLITSYAVDNKAVALLHCMERMTEADKDRLIKIGSALAQSENGEPGDGSQNTGA